MATAKTDWVLRILIAVLLLFLAAVIVNSLREKVIAVGDRAPQFQIVTDSGKQMSVSDFGGRLLVLNFWATWCPPCLEEMPSLDRLQAQLAGNGVVVLAISVDQDAEAYRRFLQRTPVSFQTARDPEATISAEYGTFKYPETYVIDATGRVVQKHIGPQLWTDPNLIREIRALIGR